MEAYKYQVAISCLKQEEPLAQQLYDLVHPRVSSVFFYPQNQKDLIGEEGVETFRQIFRHESRIVVVLYRDGWGKSPWTGVEDLAIRDMCLESRFRRVLVYSVDGCQPSWLPDSHLWAGQRYGLTALAA
jgi:hypothetical protein